MTEKLWIYDLRTNRHFTGKTNPAALEDSSHPKALANAAKQVAFTRYGELNLNGMVDAQIAVLESELLAGNAITS